MGEDKLSAAICERFRKPIGSASADELTNCYQYEEATGWQYWQPFTVEQWSKLYCVYPTDYGIDGAGVWRARGEWLLISSGCGLMMSVMDAEPRFRWCVDIDTDLKDPRCRFEDWLVGMERLTERICVVGGWAITSPAPLIAALRKLRQRVVVYATTVPEPPDPFAGFARAHSLREFLGMMDAPATHRFGRQL